MILVLSVSRGPQEEIDRESLSLSLSYFGSRVSREDREGSSSVNDRPIVRISTRSLFLAKARVTPTQISSRPSPLASIVSRSKLCFAALKRLRFQPRKERGSLRFCDRRRWPHARNLYRSFFRNCSLRIIRYSHNDPYYLHASLFFLALNLACLRALSLGSLWPFFFGLGGSTWDL